MRIAVLFILLLKAIVLDAQKVISIEDTTQTFIIGTSTIPYRDVEETIDGFRVTYEFEKALIMPDDIYTNARFWHVDGFGLEGTGGKPSIPRRLDTFVIPAYATNIDVDLEESVFTDIPMTLAPARIPLSEDTYEGYTLANVDSIEPFTGYYPTDIVSLLMENSYRGAHLIHISVAPIQYNYSTKTIRAYTKITYNITFEETRVGGNDGGNMLGSTDYILSNITLNPISKRNEGEEAVLANEDYLIVSVNKYASAVNKFAEWKKTLGYNTHVVMQESWSSYNEVKTIVDGYYQSDSIYYLLLIGDAVDVPTQTLSNIITDTYYGCIDSTYIPNIYVGRLPVSNLNEALIVVDKIISYEKTPIYDTSFYAKGLHITFFQDEDIDGYEDRRFAKTSEEVRDYMLSLGKTVNRVYQTESHVYPSHWSHSLYSNGEEIPVELQKPNYLWDGDASGIKEKIDSGCFYVLYRDHGGKTTWNHPIYSVSNINQLVNGDKLPVVFSICCSTGYFLFPKCFAEAFLRKANGGCVGIFAASAVSYSGHNDALTDGMFDAIWPSPGLHPVFPNKNNSYTPVMQPIYNLGKILLQGKMRNMETWGANNVSTSKYTFEVFHCFGDPSMNIRTMNPSIIRPNYITRTNHGISVESNLPDVYISFYDSISGKIDRFKGQSVFYRTEHADRIRICVSGVNMVPCIDEPQNTFHGVYLQNEEITDDRVYHAYNIYTGNDVTTLIPQGDVVFSNGRTVLNGRFGVHIMPGTKIEIGAEVHVATEATNNE